jgi:hypothetical protein
VEVRLAEGRRGRDLLGTRFSLRCAIVTEDGTVDTAAKSLRAPIWIGTDPYFSRKRL